MYTIIIDTRPQYEECDDFAPCINCNWKFDYFLKVKEAATIRMNKWNSENDSIDHVEEWEIFTEEAIDDVRKMPFVRTICDNCDYCD
jgi:hypothetical protein